MRPFARSSLTRTIMPSVPSAPSIATGRPSRTTQACPTSKEERASRTPIPIRKLESSSRPARCAPSWPSAASNPGATSETADHLQSMILKRAHGTAQHAVVSARPQGPQDPTGYARRDAFQSRLRSRRCGRVKAPTITMRRIDRPRITRKSRPSWPSFTPGVRKAFDGAGREAPERNDEYVVPAPREVSATLVGKSPLRHKTPMGPPAAASSCGAKVSFDWSVSSSLGSEDRAVVAFADEVDNLVHDGMIAKFARNIFDSLLERALVGEQQPIGAAQIVDSLA